MKKTKQRYLAGLLVLAFIMSVGCATSTSQTKAVEEQAMAPTPGPKVVVSPVAAPIDKKASIVIMGSGFQPGQEIAVLFEDNYGALGVLDEVKANERGSWATVWKLGRYTRRGIIKEGAFAIMAADMDYNVLASCPVGFVNVKKDPKEWPDWAKAAGVRAKEKKKK
jgi:hypothetical protein